MTPKMALMRYRNSSEQSPIGKPLSHRRTTHASVLCEGQPRFMPWNGVDRDPEERVL
ncbi:Hypothetical predicted protein [Pelobates cultripes]|uniref:Uncharacterized protein n=1 Tax=Pelobates cultripes TaxID=61616 RepID=A0AAD1WKC9_PELCU|nr:Hypothetical predicted protein [Pelobates cultripes]